MRVTLLGHASVLVELQRRTVLIDPVLADPFADGMLVSCPARSIDRARLPRIDVVVLSDARPDRFDIATFASLPRDITVICPNDPTILYVLERLGFGKVRPTPPSSVIKLDEFELVTTPSARKAPEFGVLLKDRSGTLWHPVATAVTSAIVDQVRTQIGPIDLLLAAHASPDLSYFGLQRAGFPGPVLTGAVAIAARIAPKLVVPGSAGIRFADPFAWTNAFLFPISGERFLADLARAAPRVRSAQGNPGDVFEIGGGAVERRPGASAVATMIADDRHRIVFDPTAPVPALTDPNCDGYSPTILEKTVHECFTGLATFVRAAYTTDPVLAEHRRVGGSYGLGVVFPDGRERWLRVQLGATAPTVDEGEGTLRGTRNTQRIASSVLTARARSERGYPYPGGLTRLTRTSPASLVDGKVTIDPREPPDLLMHWLKVRPPGWAVRSKQMLDFRIASCLPKGRAS